MRRGLLGVASVSATLVLCTGFFTPIVAYAGEPAYQLNWTPETLPNGGTAQIYQFPTGVSMDASTEETLSTSDVEANTASLATELGISEEAALPLDAETFGLAAIIAPAATWAVGTYGPAISQSVTDFSNKIWTDALSWASLHTSSLGATPFTSGLTQVLLDGSTADMANQFANYEASKYDVQIPTNTSPGSPWYGSYTDSVGNSYQVEWLNSQTVLVHVLKMVGTEFDIPVTIDSNTAGNYTSYTSSDGVTWSQTFDNRGIGDTNPSGVPAIRVLSQYSGSGYIEYSTYPYGGLPSSNFQSVESLTGSDSYPSGQAVAWQTPSGPITTTKTYYASGDSAVIPPITQPDPDHITVPKILPTPSGNPQFEVSPTIGTDAKTGHATDPTSDPNNDPTTQDDTNRNTVQEYIMQFVNPFNKILQPFNDLVTAFSTGWSTGSQTPPVLNLPDIIHLGGLLGTDGQINVNFSQWDNWISTIRSWITWVVWGIALVMSIRSVIRQFESM